VAWVGAVLEVETDRGVLHPEVLAARSGLLAHLVTAQNPAALSQSEERNAQADAELSAALIEAGLSAFRARGKDAASSWSEEGFCILGLSRDQAIELGRRFGQLAIYESSATSTLIIVCSDGREISVGGQLGA